MPNVIGFKFGDSTGLYDYDNLADKPTIDTTPTENSSNAVQSGGVYIALSDKVDKISGKGLSTEDFTSAEKTKLAGIEEGATNVEVDATPTESSTNAVQSGAVYGIQEKLEETTARTMASYPTDTASGSIASFPDGADGIPVESCVVQIEPMQSGSGDPSPDNVRPISGWTGAQVVRTGVNVWDEEWELGTFDNNTGEPVPESRCIRAKNFIPVVPETTYYGFIANDMYMTRLYYDSSYNFIGQVQSTRNGTFVTPSVSAYMKFRTETSKYVAPYNHDISINYPSTDHDYHLYAGDTYSITFPTEAGTVYGGVLDVTNGVLTVDRAFIASYNGETLPSEWISDRDKYVAGTTPTTGAQVCYKLSQAVVYTLSPTEIKSLLGDNNIWVDAGDTEVTYRADTALYIDKKIAEVINALS